MKLNPAPLIILIGVQFLLWKGIPLLSNQIKAANRNQDTDTISNTLRATLKGHALRVSTVAITADGNTIVSGSDDNTIKIWDSKNGSLKRTLNGHTASVIDLKITPDNNYLISTDFQSTSRIWNMQTGKLIREIPSYSVTNFLEVSQDGQTLVRNGDSKTLKNTETKVNGNYSFPNQSEITKGLINVYNLKTGILKNQLVYEKPSLQFIYQTSPNCNFLITGDLIGRLNMWNFKSGALQKTLIGHYSAIKSIAISPDEKTIVSTDAKGIIKIWDSNSGILKSTFTGHNLVDNDSVKTIIPNNNTLVTWSNYDNYNLEKNNIKVWNLQNGELKYVIKPTKIKIKDSYIDNKFYSVKVSSDSKNLITQSQSGVDTWELTTGLLKNTVKLEGNFLAISPNGETLTTDNDGEIKIWRTSH